MTTSLVGLMGRARSGKDTLAAFLTEEHGFTRYAFADPLKAAARALDPYVVVEPAETGPLASAGLPPIARPWEPSTCHLSTIVDAVGWEAAKEVRAVRALLQRLGVAMRDHVDPDVWVNATLNRAAAHFQWSFPASGSVVITDVRFPNEADAIRSAGGLLVRVVREGAGLSGTTGAHASETALDDYAAHLTIENNGTLDDLRRAAGVLLQSV